MLVICFLSTIANSDMTVSELLIGETYLAELDQSDNVVEVGLALCDLTLQQTDLFNSILDVLCLH